jgi:hypothetical protein
MNSIWKDLLFLHGYLVRKEDLIWREEVHAEPQKSEKTDTRKRKSATVQCCMAVWPRLSVPR